MKLNLVVVGNHFNGFIISDAKKFQVLSKNTYDISENATKNVARIRYIQVINVRRKRWPTLNQLIWFCTLKL